MIGRLFLVLAFLCFCGGMFTHFWATALAEIESVQVEKTLGSGFTASRGSHNVRGGMLKVSLYQYRYSIAGQTYSSWGTNPKKVVFRQKSSKQTHAVYEPIKIYYLPFAPTLSVTKRGVPLVAFLTLLLLGILFWYIGRRYR